LLLLLPMLLLFPLLLLLPLLLLAEELLKLFTHSVDMKEVLSGFGGLTILQVLQEGVRD